LWHPQQEARKVSNKVADVEVPPGVAAIREAGFATWVGDSVAPALRDKFDAARIPVRNIRHVRVWGLQVDDERALPGRERTSIPDEDIWEVSLEATDGSTRSFDSRLLKAAD
jgi:hypothetical protein